MPFSAPLPVPTIIDVGVASPKAHGQAITSTDIAATRADSKSPDGTKKYHTIKVTSAIPITIGTK